MTLNKDVFLTDPTDRQIPNLGVAKIEQPGTTEEWEVLRVWEAGFVDYDVGMHGSNQEMILIFGAHLALMRDSEEIQLIVRGPYCPLFM